MAVNATKQADTWNAKQNWFLSNKDFQIIRKYLSAGIFDIVKGEIVPVVIYSALTAIIISNTY